MAVLIVGPMPQPDGIVEPIMWGLEEEGIPAEVRPAAAATPVEMAKQAADSSHLDVAIAVTGSNGPVVLHHRDLMPDEPLFVLRDKQLEPAELRRLGINAARLVKGNPLVMADDPAAAPSASDHTRTAAGVDGQVTSARRTSTAPSARGQRTSTRSEHQQQPTTVASRGGEFSKELVEEIATLVASQLMRERGWQAVSRQDIRTD